MLLAWRNAKIGLISLWTRFNYFSSKTVINLRGASSRFAEDQRNNNRRTTCRLQLLYSLASFLQSSEKDEHEELDSFWTPSHWG